jgi:hypothetical protein
VTSLAAGVVPYADTERPDEEDAEVQRIARALGVAPAFVANIAEETALGIFNRTGERPPLEDVLAALEVAAVENLGIVPR